MRGPPIETGSGGISGDVRAGATPAASPLLARARRVVSSPPWRNQCVVVGIGPGNGAAFARRFDADGHAVALLARLPAASRELAASLPHAHSWECDVGDGASVERTFDAIRVKLGDPEVVIYNAGSGVFGSFDDVTAADFEASWRSMPSACSWSPSRS